MALHRDSGPSPRDMKATNLSVPDIGRALRAARERADYSVLQASTRASLSVHDVEAMESGTVSRLRDRVETLRSLRTYADSLGLPGNDYVLAVLDLWPSVESGAPRAVDSGQVPVVSLSAAPAGGHSPAGDGATGVTDFSISGVVSPLGVDTYSETGAFAILETGEMPAVRQTPPSWLKGLVIVAAVLVVLGIFVLVEHDNFSPWARSVRTDANHWVHNGEVAAGVTSNPPKTTHHHTAGGKAPAPKVTVVENVTASSTSITVHASSFRVEIAAARASSWFEVTDSTQPTPVYQQVLPAGQTMSFTVTHTLTVETGSGAARTYIFEGLKLIGYYIPQKAPYTVTFTAVG
jgi:Helix-turn-helix domain